VDQSSPIFLTKGEGVVVDEVFFSDVRYVDPFRRYSRSKSKVVRNRAEILMFLALPNFRGLAFQKLYAHYHPSLAARGLEMFRVGTPIIPEVMRAHTRNFRANFKFLLFFFGGGGPPSPLWCALYNHAQSLACVKI